MSLGLLTMKMRLCFSLLMCCGLVLLNACSSGNGVTPQTATISPASGDIFTSGTIQFSSNVSANPAKITWAVNGTAGGDATNGTIDSTGLYTAPATQPTGTVSVSATNTKDSSLTASATVAVVGTGTVAATNNSQVALYTIAPPVVAGVTVQFGTDTTYGLTTWTQNSTGNSTPLGTYVAGMKANTQYHMRATLLMPDGTTINDADHTFTTGSLPTAQIPAIAITTPTSGVSPQSGVQMLDLLYWGGPPIEAIDLQGNVLWYFKPAGGTAGDIVQPVKQLENGHYIVTYSPNSTWMFTDATLPAGTLNETMEVDLAGNVIKSIDVATLNTRLQAAGMNYTALTVHHDVAVLPNGHWIIIVNALKPYTNLPSYPGQTINVLGDALIDLDTNLNPVWMWDSFDHLDIDREPWMFPDWTHSNAVLYSPTDGNLLLSMRHQSWIIKIDYSNGTGTGDVIWHLGYQGDFAFDGTSSGGTAPLDWFTAEHGPAFTTSTTAGQFGLSVFDNGDVRNLPNGENCESYKITPCPFSTAQVYTIDETAMTATQTFLQEMPSYSYFGGNADVVKNGDVEADMCTTLPSSNVYNTETVEYTNATPPQLVWTMTMPGANAYRSFRLPSLYPGVQW
jgi:arylsulfate sulfotransferase